MTMVMTNRYYSKFLSHADQLDLKACSDKHTRILDLIKFWKRQNKDLTNWVPMDGRRVRFEYRGIKKQCSGCYGPHIKKFCKYDWMSMEEYKQCDFDAHYNIVDIVSQVAKDKRLLFFKMGMGKCVEKLHRLTSTIMAQKYYCQYNYRKIIFIENRTAPQGKWHGCHSKN